MENKFFDVLSLLFRCWCCCCCCWRWCYFVFVVVPWVCYYNCICIIIFSFFIAMMFFIYSLMFYHQWCLVFDIVGAESFHDINKFFFCYLVFLSKEISNENFKNNPHERKNHVNLPNISFTFLIFKFQLHKLKINWK